MKRRDGEYPAGVEFAAKEMEAVRGAVVERSATLPKVRHHHQPKGAAEPR